MIKLIHFEDGCNFWLLGIKLTVLPLIFSINGTKNLKFFELHIRLVKQTINDECMFTDNCPLCSQKWQQTFGADEAPADVDVTVVAISLLGAEVVSADDGGVGDHLAACSHTQVADVVRHRAPKATH